MNTKIRLSVAIVVVLGSAVAVYVWWGQREAGRSNPLVLYGNVDIREVAVAFRQPGRLMKSVFEEGDTVRTGQVMTLQRRGLGAGLPGKTYTMPTCDDGNTKPSCKAGLSI